LKKLIVNNDLILSSAELYTLLLTRVCRFQNILKIHNQKVIASIVL